MEQPLLPGIVYPCVACALLRERDWVRLSQARAVRALLVYDAEKHYRTAFLFVYFLSSRVKCKDSLKLSLKILTISRDHEKV